MAADVVEKENVREYSNKAIDKQKNNNKYDENKQNKKQTKSRRNKYANEIISLTEELLNKKEGE